MAVLQGKVVFGSVLNTDIYNGQDTGKYMLTLAIDPSDASTLTDAGVIVKEYEGTPQRKFSSKFPVVVIDIEGEPHVGDVPYGSIVRVLYSAPTDKAHPVHGTPTYMAKVRVIELAVREMEGEEDL